LESDSEVRKTARLIAKLDSLIKRFIARPRVFGLDYFLDALRSVRCIVLIIGNPGTGKTEHLARLIRGDVRVCNADLPKPA